MTGEAATVQYQYCTNEPAALSDGDDSHEHGAAQYCNYRNYSTGSSTSRGQSQWSDRAPWPVAYKPSRWWLFG
jgi:hypothetical protein